MNRGSVNLVTGFGHTSMAVGCPASTIHVSSKRSHQDPPSQRNPDEKIASKIETQSATDLAAKPTDRKYMLYGAFFLVLCFIVLSDR